MSAQVLVLASHNADKAAELSDMLTPLGFDVRLLSEFTEAPPPEETGATFEENALIKARSALSETGRACLSDDSGLCVPALGGAPGVFSARYGGFSTAAERNVFLLEQMKHVDDRRAYFECCVVLLFPDGRELRASGRCDGEILRAPRGTRGFGYDPLFFVPELGRSMGELSGEEKAAVSHRGRALRKLALMLS